jgi:hypothetical protein
MGKTSLQAIFAYIWRSESVFGKRKKSKSVKLNLTHAIFYTVITTSVQKRRPVGRLAAGVTRVRLVGDSSGHGR